jgi:hypothetical protein
MGFLNGSQCVRNIVLRTPVRLIPRQLRTLAYQVLLRGDARTQPAWTSSPAQNIPGIERQS